MNVFRGHSRHFATSFRFMVGLLICSFFLPTPAMTAAAHENPQNAHVLRRLNSPERRAAIEEAARMEAEARTEFDRSEAAASAASAPREEKSAQTTVSASGKPAVADAQRPTEVLFNGVAGFMGMPGLQSDRYDPHNPNADQGLGFHQDGTARRADGTTGSSAAGANFDGRRAASDMADGLGGMDSMDGGGGMSDMNDPQQYFMQRGLNYGVGWLNSMGEAAFTGLFDKGRARFNFMVDMDGRINGEGDVLYPFYDGLYTTVFTQVGARSMSGMSGGDNDGRGGDRWIGNFGLGQRWYPAATVSENGASVNSGNWMIGYNAFFDNDFTRSHQRGSFGIEAQYDWLKLASNYYFPLSGWKGSYDFDNRFVEERPAEGWDVRVKGYLPFYRNLAVTGTYSQWHGDHVGMFSSADLEKDPKVWSYGLEYTPVPMVSGFWNQRSTERGRSATEFGIRFTYHFGMSWDKQTRHAKVAELRTVGGSRHEFVDRENRIILEYKAKNAYLIEYLGPNGTGVNEFVFRVRDGFDAFKAGQAVRVTASTAHAADFSQSYTTDRQGKFVVRVSSAFSGPVTLHVRAGENTQSFTVTVVANEPSISTDSALPDAVMGVAFTQTLSASGGTAPYSFTLAGGSLPAGLALSGATISGTPTASGSFTFTIEVADGNGVTANKAFTLTVGAAVLIITTDSPLPEAAVDAAYSQAFTARGGTAPHTYAMAGGSSLPAGMSLAGDGTLGGTPTASGSFTFTIEVTDSSGVTANKEFSLTVEEAALIITTASPLPDAVVGVAYTQTLTASGGTAPYTYALASGSSLPANLSLTSDGVPSGTPTASGSFTFTVTVTDSTGTTANKEFSLTVGAAVYGVTVAASPGSMEAFERATFTATITKNGSPVPDNETVTWTVESGSGKFTSGSGSSDTSRTSTTNSGQATITLQGTAAGQVTVKASIGGGQGQAAVTVTAATYSISFISPPSGAQNSSPTLKVKVVNSRGTAAEDVSVSWSYKNVHGGTSESIPPATPTNASGEAGKSIPYSSGERRTVTVTASVTGDSAATDVQFGDALASPYIALMPGTPGSYSDALNYCQSQGGQLPSSTITDSSLPMNTVYWGNTYRNILAHSTWPPIIDSYSALSLGSSPDSSTWRIQFDGIVKDGIQKGNLTMVFLKSATRVVCVP